MHSFRPTARISAPLTALLILATIMAGAAAVRPDAASAQVPATITIVKDASPDSFQDFEFTGDLGSFELEDDGDNADGEANSQTFSNLDPLNGPFDVTETLPVGWTLSSVVCVGGTGPNGGGTAITNGVSINVEAGDTATCTFTNTATFNGIEIQKVCVPSNDPGAFAVAIVGAISISNLPCGDAFSVGGFSTPGTKTVEESEAIGTDLDLYTTSFSGDCTATGPRTATFDISGTLQLECVITNTLIDPQTGVIIIQKDTDPNSATLFPFTDDIPGCDIGSLEDDGSGTENTVTCSGVPIGQYTVTEDDPSGLDHDLTRLVCLDPTENSTDSLANRTVTIDLADDETVTCTFTNTAADTEPTTGSITIVKDTNPETSDELFDFDSPELGIFDLEDDESRPFDDLDPGTYTILEEEPDGWELVEIDCGSADVSIDLDERTVEIDLAEGDDVTCTFVNESTGDDDDDPQTPSTPSPAPSPIPTRTPAPTPPAVAGQAPMATPSAPALSPSSATANVTRLPATGTGGFREDGAPWPLAVVAAGIFVFVLVVRRSTRQG